MNQFTDPIEDYLHFIRVERQLSDNTLQSYKRDLVGYAKHLKQHQQLPTFNEVTRQHILLYLETLRNQGKSARTVSRHISSIRSFHQFLLREKVAETDPTVHLEMPKVEQKLPKVLSIEEIDAAYCSTQYGKTSRGA